MLLPGSHTGTNKAVQGTCKAPFQGLWIIFDMDVRLVGYRALTTTAGRGGDVQQCALVIMVHRCYPLCEDHFIDVQVACKPSQCQGTKPAGSDDSHLRVGRNVKAAHCALA